MARRKVPSRFDDGLGVITSRTTRRRARASTCALGLDELGDGPRWDRLGSFRERPQRRRGARAHPPTFATFAYASARDAGRGDGRGAHRRQPSYRPARPPAYGFLPSTESGHGRGLTPPASAPASRSIASRAVVAAARARREPSSRSTCRTRRSRPPNAGHGRCRFQRDHAHAAARLRAHPTRQPQPHQPQHQLAAPTAAPTPAPAPDRAAAAGRTSTRPQHMGGAVLALAPSLRIGRTRYARLAQGCKRLRFVSRDGTESVSGSDWPEMAKEQEAAALPDGAPAAAPRLVAAAAAPQSPPPRAPPPQQASPASGSVRAQQLGLLAQQQALNSQQLAHVSDGACASIALVCQQQLLAS